MIKHFPFIFVFADWANAQFFLDSRHTIVPPVLIAPNPPALPGFSFRPSTKPSRKPAARPSTKPLSAPLIKPILRPSTFPTLKPTPKSTVRLTSKQTQYPSAKRTPNPSTKPSTKPSTRPSAKASLKPSSKPSEKPKTKPTSRPSAKPSPKPTQNPSTLPSAKRTTRPSAKPTSRPTVKPSENPTQSPSALPSENPISHPSVNPTLRPSAKPSKIPTQSASALPISKPTSRPSAKSTSRPSAKPSSKPTRNPSGLPSSKLSPHPSAKPTSRPTVKPSKIPTQSPLALRSENPSSHPSVKPALRPSAKPTMKPTHNATGLPSSKPTPLKPSSRPSVKLSHYPTQRPSTLPTEKPTSHPSVKPTSHAMAKPSKNPTFQPLAKPSTKPSAESTAHHSVKPTPKLRCAINAAGDFGDTSNANNGLTVSFNYEMIVNASKIEMTKTTESSVLKNVELAVTDALLGVLFTSCALSSKPSTTRIIRSRTLQITNTQVLGISSLPNDIISSDSCEIANLSTDMQCYVVFSRLTIYTNNPSDSSSIILNALSSISSSMDSGALTKANDALIKLIFLVPSEDKNILYVPSIIPGQQFIAWPAVLGAFLGLGLLVLVLLALRRYSMKKDSRDREMEDDESQFSLSAIWDEKALDGLETAESYELFKASQPVLRSKTPSPTNIPPPIRENLSSVAVKSAVLGSVLRLVRHDDEVDYSSVGSNVSDPSLVLGIAKSPTDKANEISEECFVDALYFIPFSSSTLRNPRSTVKEDFIVPKRPIGEEQSPDIGDISLVKSCLSVSDIDESEGSSE